MDDVEEVEQITSELEEAAARRARQKAYVSRWNLDVAVFAFAVLIIVVILLFQDVRLEIVAPVAIVGLALVWLAGWWQGRQLFKRFYEEELAGLEKDAEAAKSVEETVEEIIQKALRNRWQ